MADYLRITADITDLPLYGWDISDVEDTIRVLDVRGYTALALTITENKVNNVTWDDTISVYAAVRKDGVGRVNFGSTVDITTANQTVFLAVAGIPYIVIEPDGSPTTGTTIDIEAFVEEPPLSNAFLG